MPRGKDTSSHPSRKVHREGILGRQQSQPQAPSGGQQSQPQASQPATPTPSGRGMYRVHGNDGGGYLRTTPVEGSDDRHDVTYYSDDHKPQYNVTGARFLHDPEKNEASFSGGKDTGSGEFMKHSWRGKTFGGNVHDDNYPG